MAADSAAAAAAAARQARVAHLSIDGALENDAGGSLQAFEAASQELQSPIAAVRQGAEATLLQLRAPGMESDSGAGLRDRWEVAWARERARQRST